jgi:hypothetical protein
MKKYDIYFANGVVESVLKNNIKEAKAYAKKRQEEIPMVVLQVYEDFSYIKT